MTNVQQEPALSLTDWLIERRDNALRFASRKSGDDRAGWLEDADYLQRAITVLAAVPLAAPAEPPRMLTEYEIRALMNECVGKSPRDLPAAIQRKLFEVNAGRTIPAIPAKE